MRADYDPVRGTSYTRTCTRYSFACGNAPLRARSWKWSQSTLGLPRCAKSCGVSWSR